MPTTQHAHAPMPLPLPPSLSPDEVARHVAAAWGGDPPHVDLLRASWNDTYLVTAPDGTRTRSIIRCTAPAPTPASPTDALPYPFHGGGQSVDALADEARLLEHLHRGGGVVARAIPTRDGAWSLPVDTAKGTRHLLRFTYAPGEVLTPHPFVRDDWTSAVGSALGRLHAVAASAPPFIARPPRDRRWLLDVPLQLISSHLAAQPAQQDTVARLDALVSETGAQLAAFASAGLPDGVLHGDAFNSNASITADGTVTWYDFDLSGPGLPARDLAGAWSCLHLPNVPETQRPQRWQRFLRAYLAANPLSSAALATTLQAIPTLALAGQINSIALHLANPATRAGLRDAAWWARAVAALDAAQQITAPPPPA